MFDIELRPRLRQVQLLIPDFGADWDVSKVLIGQRSAAIDAVLADIVQATNEWRHLNGCARTFSRRVNRCGLLLRETKSHVDSYAFRDRGLRCFQTFRCAWVLDIRVRYPCEHLAALRQHLASGRIQICKYFNRNTSAPNQRRDRLDNFLVLGRLLTFRQRVAELTIASLLGFSQ